MANTIMTAKNTFEEGLIMDLIPDNTLSNCLTSALNATLLTFNGNEMALLNDFGNARVETAFLPEGYVPIGTCEFGDIIYIVSYNPLTNKSLIGCFPSPERNISSDEVSDLNVSISSSELASGGRIKAMSVKKVLFDKKLHAGDKFMIYTTDNLSSNGSRLSDYGNTAHVHGYFPKLTKIHVVSIEDSGKTTVLDSSVKWYDNDYYINKSATTITNSLDLDAYRNLVSSAWSIFQSKISGKLALLIELESITGFSCTHTVKSETTKGDTESTTYKIYLNASWTTNHNDINPSGIILTNAGWQERPNKGLTGLLLYGKNSSQKVGLPGDLSKKDNYSSGSVIPFSRLYRLESPSGSYSSYINSDSYNAKINNVINSLLPVPVYNITLSKNLGSYYCNLSSIKDGTYYYVDLNGLEQAQSAKSISDDVVNNYFFKDVRKHIGDLPAIITSKIETEGDKKIRYKSNLTNLIWEYTVAPAMPYGVLDLFAITNSIDFSKVGNKSIELTDWRYYNSGELSTLVIGLDAYTLEDYGISEICLEFYDNNGKAAAYHITDKSSYSGEFTNYILLNSKNRNHQLSDVDSEGNIFKHVGTAYVDEGKEDADVIELGGEKYYNDAGTLYPNFLYLVKIVVKYSQVNELGQFSDEKDQWVYFYRWYWTTTMFNDLYFLIKDFVNLQPQLYLNSSIQFTDIGISKSVDTYHYSRTDENTLGAVVTHINLEYNEETKELIKKPNIKAKLNIGLEEDYGIFNLNKDGADFKGKLYLGKSSITTDYDGADDVKPVIMEEEELLKPEIGYVPKNTLGTEFYKSIGLEEIFKGNPDNEIYSTEESYKEYKDTFGIEFEKDASGKEEISYEDVNGEKQKESYDYIEIKYEDEIKLVLSGIRYNKFKYTKTEKHNYLKYTSILNKYGLNLLSLGFDGTHMFFKTVSFIGAGDKKRHSMHVYFNTGNTDTNKVPFRLNPINRMTPGGDERVFNIQSYSEIPAIVSSMPSVPVPLYLIGYDDDGENDWTKAVDAPNRITKLQLALWGSASDWDHDFYGKRTPPGCSSKENYIATQTNHVCILGFKFNSVLYAMNDVFITHKAGLTQIFNNPGKNTYNENSIGFTMADFVANLYSNLYVYSTEELVNTGVEISLDLSTEVWDKEIITKLEIPENCNNNLLFYQCDFSQYVSSVEGLVSGPDYDKEKIKNNVDFIIQAETKCTDLSFKLEGCKVEEQDLNSSMMIETKEDNIFAEKAGKGPYYVLENNTLVSLSNTSFMYKVSKWEKGKEEEKYFPVPDEKVKFKIPLLVLKLIKCEDSRVYFDGDVLGDEASETINWVADEGSDKIQISPFYNFSLLNNLTWNG